MEPWIGVTLLAASAQTLRFVLQKRLTQTGLSAAGATYARFVFSAPIVAIVALLYAGLSAQSLPGLTGTFWLYAVAGGIAQILATICTVALFSHRNFAVGITFKKTEVILATLIGIVVLGDGVPGPAILAILIGLAGVLMLSRPPDLSDGILNKAAGLGLLSGTLFAISGVCYRGASLELSADPVLRAATTLACVTTFQTVAMTLWFALRDRAQIGAVLRSWRVSGLVGLASLTGSLCWFIAFTLQTVALVKAVGQIELVLSLMATWIIFSEPISRRELLGIGLVLVSILGIVLL